MLSSISASFGVVRCGGRFVPTGTVHLDIVQGPPLRSISIFSPIVLRPLTSPLHARATFYHSLIDRNHEHRSLGKRRSAAI